MGAQRKNAYYCEKCGRYTVTVDVDEGVTPMFLACRASGHDPRDPENPCDGMARSMMYPPPPWPDHPDLNAGPTWEWYRPTDVAALPDGLREHVEKGGLDLRRRGEVGRTHRPPRPRRPPTLRRAFRGIA